MPIKTRWLGNRRRAARIFKDLAFPLSVLGLTVAMTGCVGYVRSDEGAVIVAEPEVFIWGGYGGGYRRDYGRRGYESRGGRR